MKLTNKKLEELTEQVFLEMAVRSKVRKGQSTNLSLRAIKGFAKSAFSTSKISDEQVKDVADKLKVKEEDFEQFATNDANDNFSTVDHFLDKLESAGTNAINEFFETVYATSVKDLTDEEKIKILKRDATELTKFQGISIANLDLDNLENNINMPFLKAIRVLGTVAGDSIALEEIDLDTIITGGKPTTAHHGAAKIVLNVLSASGNQLALGSNKQEKTFINKLEKIIDLYSTGTIDRLGPKSTITAPEFGSRRGTAIGKANTAPFPPDQLKTIKTFVGSLGANNFTGRVKKITDFSKLFFDASKNESAAINTLRTKNAKEILNSIMVLDIFNYIAKDMDHGSGAYLFEYFCALLMEGSIRGKESGESGGMGATDFVASDGSAGSAKFYGKPINISQATTGFITGVNQVNYIIGIKKDVIENVGVGAPGPESFVDTDTLSTVAGASKTSDPTTLVGIDMHVIPVKLSLTGKGKKKTKVFKVDDVKVTTTGGKSDGSSPRVVLDDIVQGGQHYIGTMYLSKGDTTPFRTMVSEAVDSLDVNIKEAFAAMKLVFSEMNSAKENTKNYINTGKTETGNDAFEAVHNMETQIAELIEKLNASMNPKSKKSDPYGGTVAATAASRTARTMAESLDDLIKQVLTEIKTKHKLK
jgi:hypothetical protein